MMKAKPRAGFHEELQAADLEDLFGRNVKSWYRNFVVWGHLEKGPECQAKEPGI